MSTPRILPARDPMSKTHSGWGSVPDFSSIPRLWVRCWVSYCGSYCIVIWRWEAGIGGLQVRGLGVGVDLDHDAQPHRRQAESELSSQSLAKCCRLGYTPRSGCEVRGLRGVWGVRTVSENSKVRVLTGEPLFPARRPWPFRLTGAVLGSHRRRLPPCPPLLPTYAVSPNVAQPHGGRRPSRFYDAADSLRTRLENGPRRRSMAVTAWSPSERVQARCLPPCSACLSTATRAC